jgi:hypothetical protein
MDCFVGIGGHLSVLRVGGECESHLNMRWNTPIQIAMPAFAQIVQSSLRCVIGRIVDLRVSVE